MRPMSAAGTARDPGQIQAISEEEEAKTDGLRQASVCDATLDKSRLQRIRKRERERERGNLGQVWHTRPDARADELGRERRSSGGRRGATRRARWSGPQAASWGRSGRHAENAGHVDTKNPRSCVSPSRWVQPLQMAACKECKVENQSTSRQWREPELQGQAYARALPTGVPAVGCPSPRQARGVVAAGGEAVAPSVEGSIARSIRTEQVEPHTGLRRQAGI